MRGLSRNREKITQETNWIYSRTQHSQRTIAPVCSLPILSLIFLLIMTVAIGFSSVAHGQTPPASVDPGRITDEFRAAPTPQVEKKSVIDEKKSEQPSAIAGEGGELKFTLKSLTIKGNTAFSDADLSAQYADKIGTEITVNELHAIAQAMTVMYRNAGFVLSRAVIPPQRISEGHATIEVIEGFIANVEFAGDFFGNQSFLEYVARQIEAEKPSNIHTIERYLLLLNDLAGQTAKSVIMPAPDQQNAANLLITMQHRDVEYGLRYDNTGSVYVGPGSFVNQIGFNSLFQQGEAIRLRNILTEQPEELRYGDLSIDLPLYPEGTKLSVFISRSHTFPGADLKDLHIFGNSLLVATEISQPFIRSRDKNFSLAVGFDSYNSTTTQFDSAIITRDHLRVFKTRADADYADQWGGVSLLSLSARQGISDWGASELGGDTTRTNGRPSFFTLRGLFTHSHPLDQRLSLFTALNAQYASVPVLVSEQFGIGGSQFGRAYDPSEITGDHGAALKIELQFFPENFRILPFSEASQLYLFYDTGVVHKINSEDFRDTLSSSGFGIRTSFGDSMYGTAEVAFPLTRPISAYGVDKGSETQFNFSFGYNTDWNFR